MSLLKKFVASAPKANGAEEIAIVTVLAIVGAAPVMVNDVPKDRLRAIVSIDGQQFSSYLFASNVVGAPAFIPTEGVQATALIQETEGLDSNGQKKQYVNIVHLGIKA